MFKECSKNVQRMFKEWLFVHHCGQSMATRTVGNMLQQTLRLAISIPEFLCICRLTLTGKLTERLTNWQTHSLEKEWKKSETELWSTHHRPQVGMVEDVAVVVHCEAVPVHTKLGGKYTAGGQKKVTLYGGISFSISAIGTSVPATPRSSAMRT